MAQIGTFTRGEDGTLTGIIWTEMQHANTILTGGVDANALQRPKRFFGAARNHRSENQKCFGAGSGSAGTGCSSRSGGLVVAQTLLVAMRKDLAVFARLRGRAGVECLVSRIRRKPPLRAKVKSVTKDTSKPRAPSRKGTYF
jgi:hypothetical protein